MADVRLVDNGLTENELSGLDRQFGRLRIEAAEMSGVKAYTGGYTTPDLMKIKEERYLC